MKHTLILIFLLTIPALGIQVEVNGQTLPAQPAAINDQGRVLVPMRAIFQALGAEVHYQAGTISSTRASDMVVLSLNSSRAQINGSSVNLDVAPRLLNGTTYVPLRFVAQALGEEVSWNPNDKRVLVGQISPASPAPAGFSARTQLPRLVVGNQGGILKVRDQNLKSDVYYRGIDDRAVARFSPADQQAILELLGLNGAVDTAAAHLMSNYSSLPKRETLALLGLFNSLDGTGTRINHGTAVTIREFLVKVMQGDSDVVNRRQAVLALAVGGGLEPQTVEAVVDFYQGSSNLWETFPVQQFFEYQAHRIQEMANFLFTRNRVSAVSSLYRDNIVGYLSR